MKQFLFFGVLVLLFTTSVNAQKSNNGCITCLLEEYIGIYLNGGSSSGAGSWIEPGSRRKIGSSSGWVSTSRSIYNGRLVDNTKSDFNDKYVKDNGKVINQAYEVGLKTNSYPQIVYSKKGEPIFVYKDKVVLLNRNKLY